MSSNATNQCKELRRIDDENKRLLRRLQGAKPTVNRSKMDKDFNAQQKVMRMRCEHQKPEWPKPEPLLKLPVLEGHAVNPADGDIECNPFFELHQYRACELDAIDDAEAPEDTHALSPALREMIGGDIPAHSRAIVDKLMACEANDEADDPEPCSDDKTADDGSKLSARSGVDAADLELPRGLADQLVDGDYGEAGMEGLSTEEAAAAAKAAADDAMRQAEALGVRDAMGGLCGDEHLLHYDNVVLRARHSLAAIGQ